MLGRTHFFIGTAAALAVLQPQTVPVLVTGAGAAAIGSLISDICLLYTSDAADD